MDNRFKQLGREQFAQQFADTDSLMKQMAAVPITEGPFTKGIRITDLAESSAFIEIGLTPGDIVEYVNASPVTSAQQFLQSLKTPPEGELVRIERKRDGMILPIYIHLN
jgi:type II secretory pathway component PulC